MHIWLSRFGEHWTRFCSHMNWNVETPASEIGDTLGEEKILTNGERYEKNMGNKWKRKRKEKEKEKNKKKSQ